MQHHHMYVICVHTICLQHLRHTGHAANTLRCEWVQNEGLEAAYARALDHFENVAARGSNY